MIQGKLVKKTPPSVEPLTVEEVKRHLRVDGTEEDLRIEQLIQAAREYCEEITGRSFVQQGLQFYPLIPYARTIDLPRPPLVSVDEVRFYFDDGSSVVVNSDLYLVDLAGAPGQVVLKRDAEWPEEPDKELREINPVEISFTAGYGLDGSSVPQRLRQAMYLLIGHWWENREDSITAVVIDTIPIGVHSLLQMERMF